jgi:hypothetical protein
MTHDRLPCCCCCRYHLQLEAADSWEGAVDEVLQHVPAIACQLGFHACAAAAAAAACSWRLLTLGRSQRRGAALFINLT